MIVRFCPAVAWIAFGTKRGRVRRVDRHVDVRSDRRRSGEMGHAELPAQLFRVRHGSDQRKDHGQKDDGGDQRGHGPATKSPWPTHSRTAPGPTTA